MCSWHDHLANRLLPPYQLLATRFRKSDYVKIDETPIRCLDPGKGRTTLGQLSSLSPPRARRAFRLAQKPRSTCLDTILIGKGSHTSFQGHLQSDGLHAYPTFIARHPHLKIIPLSYLAPELFGMLAACRNPM